MSKSVVFFTDGSYSSKYNKAGVGLIGYSYVENARPAGVNLPFDAKYYLGKESINLTKEVDEETGKAVNVTKDNIKGVDFYEKTVALFGEKISNADGEVMGLYYALKLIQEDEEITEALIHIDNEYVVKGYNVYLDAWKERGWKTVSGKTIACLEEWQEIDRMKISLNERDVRISVKWVKGHSDSYGNQLADRYATMGTNYGKYFTLDNEKKSIVLMEKITPLTELRKELEGTNFTRYHRYMVFGREIGDEYYLTHNTVPKDRVDTLGYKYNKTTYSMATTGIPEYIRGIMEVYYGFLQRPPYHILDVSAISSKDIVRLFTHVDPRCLLLPKRQSTHTSLVLYDTGVFVVGPTDNLIRHPFVMNMIDNMTMLMDMENNYVKERPLIDKIIDVTDSFIEGGKLKLKNADKTVKLDIMGHQNVILVVGEDIPSYLFLNKYAPDIRKMEVLLDETSNANYYTLVLRITFDDGVYLSTRTVNRYIKAA